MPRTAGKPAKVLTEAEKAKIKAENRKRFLDYGANRTSKVINSLAALGKVANRRSYEFDKSDVSEIMDALKSAVKSLDNKFEQALTSTPGARTATQTFAFSKKG